MKNFLLAIIVMLSMIVTVVEAISFAPIGGGLPVIFAIGGLMLVMGLVGCLDFSPSTSDRIGWVFVILSAIFCMLTSIGHLDTTGGVAKVVMALFFGLVGVIGFMKGSKVEAHDTHAH